MKIQIVWCCCWLVSLFWLDDFSHRRESTSIQIECAAHTHTHQPIHSIHSCQRERRKKTKSAWITCFFFISCVFFCELVFLPCFYICRSVFSFLFTGKSHQHTTRHHHLSSSMSNTHDTIDCGDGDNNMIWSRKKRWIIFFGNKRVGEKMNRLKA